MRLKDVIKKVICIVTILSLCLFISACSNDVSIDKEVSVKTNNIETTENNSNTHEHQYIGDYENQPVYKKIMEIETCKDPETLKQLIFEIYGEEFWYIKMEHKSTNNPEENAYAGYEAPYEDFVCSVLTLYNATSPLEKAALSSDTYLFFKHNHEVPSFMMDSDGTYIVASYKIHNFDDGTHAHNVSARAISDLFMCLHGYIDTSTEEKSFWRDSVRYMDYYLEFENLIIDKLGENSGNILKTESLKTSTD